MKAMNSFFLFFLLLIVVSIITLSSCKTRTAKVETVSEFSAGDSDSVFVSLDHFPCFGMCPTFQFFLYGSGYALYKGKMEVKRIGTYEAHFTNEQMRMFSKVAIDNRVDTLQSEYVNPYIADFPATYSSVVIKGKRHSFHLSSEAPPEALTDFNTMVERLLELGQWKKISDKTE